jgi:hypothetical protein
MPGLMQPPCPASLPRAPLKDRASRAIISAGLPAVAHGIALAEAGHEP